ncbi:MAG: hypothetical protein IPI67_13080 [Myxococcales bacterium]|nr:hypothetical protein [Myxococcales bacterium]
MLDARTIITRVLEMAGEPVRGAKFGQLARLVEPQYSLRAYGAANLRMLITQHPDLAQIDHDEFDIVISKPTATPTVEAATTPRRHAKQIPRELWRAFTFVAPSVKRFYERATGKVLLFAEDDETLARTQEDAGFAKIESISPAEHLAFAQSFTRTAPEAWQGILGAALTEPFWFRAFTTALRRDQQLFLTWNRARTGWVQQRIEGWAKENDVSLASPVSVVSPVQQATSGVGVSGVRPPERARERILAAVSRMPLSELLTLPIPAQYWLESE